MLIHLLKTAFRNLRKHPTFSFVNIMGLAIGMAACWFIFEYVRFEESYDKWHPNAARIYRVPLEFAQYFTGHDANAENYGAVGPTLKADFPEIQDYARLTDPGQFLNTITVSYTDPNGRTERFNETHLFLADASFLRLFDFPFVHGDPATALEKPGTAVVSVSLAKKYFGGADPMGKVLYLNRDPLTVTGVFRDVPENSHIHFDMLVSFPSHFALTDWESPGYYNYVLLAPGADPRKVEAKLPAFFEKYLGKKFRSLNLAGSFHLQPLTDIHLRSTYGGEPEPQGSEKTLYFLSVLGVFLLVIAWINYVNLSTAKSLERAREVGVRKVVGASRWQLVRQFLLESMLINMIALLLMVFTVLSTGGLFDRFTGKGVNRAFLHSGVLREWRFWLIAAGIFIGGALQVGAYPALVLSAFRPVLVLKGRFQRSVKGIFLRRALVTFQFFLSVLLIAGTLVVYRQLQFMRSQDPGYKRDQLLVVKAPAMVDSTYYTRANVFKTELLKDPAIRGVAPTSDVPGHSIGADNGVRRIDQDKSSANGFADFLAIDKDFLSTYGVRLVAGTNIPEDKDGNWARTKQTRVMINETLAVQLGYRNAAAAVHQSIYFMSWFGDIRAEIVGVVQNYHQQSLAVSYKPIMYYFARNILPGYFSINLDTRNLPRSLSYIRQAYDREFPGNAFDSYFLDEQFDQQYRADRKLGSFFGLFTGLAIFIACLGLLGLSSYMIRLRVREIGIRKVLGAPVHSLLVLLSRDFIRLVLLASVIALPVVYIAGERWLRHFAFHIRLSWTMLAAPPILLLLIALITISVQSIKAALANPVESLKME